VQPLPWQALGPEYASLCHAGIDDASARCFDPTVSSVLSARARGRADHGPPDRHQLPADRAWEDSGAYVCRSACLLPAPVVAWGLARRLITCLLDHVVPPGPVLLAGDATVTEPPGPRVCGQGRQRDGGRSPHRYTA
jgi:hypothetical protein